ncbi:hypothetical protein SH2C18_41950 [Clostridium sediminicola]|uniref:Crp/Fnr family transcriptional regulator n=1 Tax=Clostridium sediminicola TaxID=3114879 RepID=UPI0031F1D294
MKNERYFLYGNHDCSEKMIEIIHKNSAEVRYKKGDTILEYGEETEYLNFIKEGKVFLITSHLNGEERIVGILEKDKIFDCTSFILNTKTKFTAVAKKNVVIYRMNKKIFNKLMDESIDFRNEILIYMSSVTFKLSELIDDIHFSDCKKRIYNLLYGSRIDDNDNEWIELKYKYTHYDIARIVGSSRVTVSKMIHELCDEDLIRTVNRKLQVKNKKYI